MHYILNLLHRQLCLHSKINNDYIGDDIPELDMPNGYGTVKIQYVVLVVQSWVRHYNPGLRFNHFFSFCVSICLIILEKPK